MLPFLRCGALRSSIPHPRTRFKPEFPRWFLGTRPAVLPAPADVPEDIIKVSAYCPKGIEAAKAALFPKWEQHFRCAVAASMSSRSGVLGQR